MKKAMESLHDLIEEAKLRTVWWILCIFTVSYFLSHTSKSMLMNIPIAVLLVSGLIILFNEVEFRWKIQNNRPISYLSRLEKKQLSVNDSRLSTLPPPQKWKRKIDSPVVEAAIEDFISKLLRDFVVDLWYSDITPDKEAPELIHGIIMDVLGEVSGRIKEVNLVDLLTRDAVDLIGDHLDLFRRNQTVIGVDVMKTLSSEERDERLKHHLLVSKDLHPALISPDSEYKVLQQLMGGLLAVVLKPRDAQCPLVRCISRELLICLVMQPIMKFASPVYINELIEYIVLAYNNEEFKDITTDQSPNVEGNSRKLAVSGEHAQSYGSNIRTNLPSSNQGTDLSLTVSNKSISESGGSGDEKFSKMQGEPMHLRNAEWAKVFEAATQRRTEVLMPENLENMWTIGRNYKKKLQKTTASGIRASEVTGLLSVAEHRKSLMAEAPKRGPGTSIALLPPRSRQVPQSLEPSVDALSRSIVLKEDVFLKGSSSIHELGNAACVASQETKCRLKKSSSTSDLMVHPNLKNMFATDGSASIINEYCGVNSNKLNVNKVDNRSSMVLFHEEPAPKLRCQVIGAYFEKLGSKSFAVYSISVTDGDRNTWSVKRRYRNFERLHRHLKDIPNYTLHLPPKRIFSSSTEDSFVHQRCIQLDKYLQDILSIANVAEQQEVWDFLSESSENYSFRKPVSAMRSLAVNVDVAVDDIVRQFKGVSDGLMSKVSLSPACSSEDASSFTSRSLSLSADDIKKLVTQSTLSESINSFSDNDEGDKELNQEQPGVEIVIPAKGSFPDYDEDVSKLDSEVIHSQRLKSESTSMNRYPELTLALASVSQYDPTATEVPAEWTPPNLTVPVLNLVDNVFQLKRRGWLRRQVFWISKQILQLIMVDAVDDWLLRQIHWLRREDVIAQGIRWVQDVLWPDGTFFLELPTQDQSCEATQKYQQSRRQQGGVRAAPPGSFHQQLEAARRASDLKKMIFDGAPATLVSLIGHKQYRRCARDVYFFLQSTVCLKQLGYGILELVLVSCFPELREVVTDIHEKSKMHNPPVPN